jgi:hypothetical protein
MRLPIHAQGLRFTAVAPAEQLRRYEKDKPWEEREPRTNEHGEVLYTVQLVVMGNNEAQVIRVTIAGDPKVSAEQSVQVEGLSALAWEMEGRSGVSFRAEKIVPQGGPAKPAQG